MDPSRSRTAFAKSSCSCWWANTEERTLLSRVLADMGRRETAIPDGLVAANRPSARRPCQNSHQGIVRRSPCRQISRLFGLTRYAEPAGS